MRKNPQGNWGAAGLSPSGKEGALKELAWSLELAERLQRILPQCCCVTGDVEGKFTVAEYLVKEFVTSVSRAMSTLIGIPEAGGADQSLQDREIDLRASGGKIQTDKVAGATKRSRAEKRKTLVTGRPLDDDGFTWKKYGQKVISEAQYPRSYFRCSQWSLHRCPATKQVQQKDDDPTKFIVTYIHSHTCQLPLPLVIDGLNEPFFIDFGSRQQGVKWLLPFQSPDDRSSLATNRCHTDTVLPKDHLDLSTNELRPSTCSEFKHCDLEFSVPFMATTALTTSSISCEDHVPMFHSPSSVSSDISTVVDSCDLISNLLWCHNEESL